MLQARLLRHWLVMRLTENVIDSTSVYIAVFQIYDSVGISLKCFLYYLAQSSALSSQDYD